MHPSTPPPSSSPDSASLTRRSRGPGLLTAVVLTASVAMNGCSTSSDQAVPAQSPTPSASASVGGSQDVHFTVGYAGDVLMHMPVMESTPAGSGDITANIAAETPWVEGLDLALCGMEVPVAPDGVYSGYPAFGTSTEVVAALARSGWDGCATASNHSWDQGFDGVVATADALRADSMGYSGTNRTQAEAAAPYQLYELTRGGMTVTVAQLSTTYGLNGFSADPDWAVNLNDVAWVEAQARAAREAGVPVLSRDAAALRVLGQIIAEDVPAIIVDVPQAECEFTADGLFRSGEESWDNPQDALSYFGVSGNGWTLWHLGGEEGPTLGESLAEVNREIIREYSRD